MGYLLESFLAGYLYPDWTCISDSPVVAYNANQIEICASSGQFKRVYGIITIVIDEVLTISQHTALIIRGSSDRCIVDLGDVNHRTIDWNLGENLTVLDYLNCGTPIRTPAGSH